MPTFSLCRHLFTDGHQCGSPALRGGPLCYHHQTLRRTPTVTRKFGSIVPQIPVPEDLHAIQRGIAEVLRLLVDDDIEFQRANFILRALDSASNNLARIHRRERTHPSVPVTDMVQHPELGSLAVAPEDDGTPYEDAGTPSGPSIPLADPSASVSSECVGCTPPSPVGSSFHTLPCLQTSAQQNQDLSQISGKTISPTRGRKLTRAERVHLRIETQLAEGKARRKLLRDIADQLPIHKSTVGKPAGPLQNATNEQQPLEPLKELAKTPVIATEAMQPHRDRSNAA